MREHKHEEDARRIRTELSEKAETSHCSFASVMSRLLPIVGSEMEMTEMLAT